MPNLTRTPGRVQPAKSKYQEHQGRAGGALSAGMWVVEGVNGDLVAATAATPAGATLGMVLPTIESGVHKNAFVAGDPVTVLWHGPVLGFDLDATEKPKFTQIGGARLRVGAGGETDDGTGTGPIVAQAHLDPKHGLIVFVGKTA